MPIILLLVHTSRHDCRDQIEAAHRTAAARCARVEVVEFSGRRPSRQELARLFSFWNPIGVIDICNGSSSPLDFLSDRLPVVRVEPDDRSFWGQRNQALVIQDSVPGGQLAARELLAQDLASFGYVDFYRSAKWSDARHRGFVKALSFANRQTRHFPPLPKGDARLTELAAWLRELPKPAGVFAATDFVALEVLSIAAQVGIDVPRDLCVVGMDNDLVSCENAYPTLTSVKTDFARSGVLAVELVFWMRANPAAPPRCQTYAGHVLVRRQSTRRAAAMDPVVARAVEWIRLNATSSIGVADVASAVDVPRRTLEQRFRKVIGRSILDVLREVRLEAAFEFLRNPQQVIGAIANQCGYDSELTLRRIFRRATGLTPRAWRAANVKGLLLGAALVFADCVWAGDPDRPKEVVSQPPSAPVSVMTNAAGRVVADFGRHAFGWLEVDAAATGRYEIVWGELLNDVGSVETNRFYTVERANVRCACTTGTFARVGWQRIPLQAGNGSAFYQGAWNQFLVPARYGNVMPFRWAEVVEAPFEIRPGSLRQVAVRYPLDLDESRFASSSPALDRVIGFCKYSIAATSFLGRFVDGDRERLTYEADSLIAQLGSYAMSSDYALARATLDWVSDHSTWPTEWKQFFVRMCWLDWMYTGDTSRIARYYELMRTQRIWSECARADGLLVTGGEAGKGKTRDIVDWAKGYRDGFVFRSVNAVVNALRYRNLLEMRDMAAALGKSADAASFAAEAHRLRGAFLSAFLDPRTGLVRDGEGTDHVTVQGNAMALSCGVLPPDKVGPAADFIVGKGMACSTYMAQFVLEALCRAGRVEAALDLMTTEGPRGWLAMLAKGATITTEFWDLTLAEKWRVPDMNHAWSTAPLNVVSRFVLGVTPLEPGFERISVAPRPGYLRRLSARVPTRKGCVGLQLDRDDGGWTVALDLPAPTRFTWGGTSKDLPAGRHAFVFGGD